MSVPAGRERDVFACAHVGTTATLADTGLWVSVHLAWEKRKWVLKNTGYPQCMGQNAQKSAVSIPLVLARSVIAEPWASALSGIGKSSKKIRAIITISEK